MNSFQKISFATYLSISLGYLTFVGCLWHLGYWATFKFNFLEFAKITDIFKSSAYPFLSNIWYLFVLIIGFIGMFYGIYLATPSPMSTPVSSERLSIKTKRIFYGIILISGFVFFIVNNLKVSYENPRNFMPYLVALFFTSIFFSTEVLIGVFKDHFKRFLVLYFLFLFPSLNFTIARKEALYIKHGIRYMEVSQLLCNDSLLKVKLTRSAYLGSTGDYHFFYAQHDVVIAKADNIASFSLKEKIGSSHFSNKPEPNKHTISILELLERIKDNIHLKIDSVKRIRNDSIQLSRYNEIIYFIQKQYDSVQKDQ